MEKQKVKTKKSKKAKYCNNFSEILNGKRNLKGKKMSLKDVERGTGISYPVLFDLKHCKRDNFDDRTVKEIASFLGVTSEELLISTYSTSKNG